MIGNSQHKAHRTVCAVTRLEKEKRENVSSERTGMIYSLVFWPKPNTNLLKSVSFGTNVNNSDAVFGAKIDSTLMNTTTTSGIKRVRAHTSSDIIMLLTAVVFIPKIQDFHSAEILGQVQFAEFEKRMNEKRLVGMQSLKGMDAKDLYTQ